MMLDRRAVSAIQQAIERVIADGEIGLQIAAYVGEELVIDAWGGTTAPVNGAWVSGDTLFNVFSVTKGITATALHLQAERGLVEYDAPIARYWPEYGSQGKTEITVAMALTHCTGAPHVPPDVTPEMLCDWDQMVRAIADLPPILPMGSPAYHSLSYGWIIGEIIRRTDPRGRSFAEFVREELLDPIGVEDVWFGVSGEAGNRVATLSEENSNAAPLTTGTLFERSMPQQVRSSPKLFERADIRRACLPSNGVIASARGMARFWAMLANEGELGGHRLLSAKRIQWMRQPRPGGNPPDPVLFGGIAHISAGGFWLYDSASPLTTPVRSRSAICAPGSGASIAWADPSTGLAVAFCHNRMTNPADAAAHPASGLADLVRSTLGLA